MNVTVQSAGPCRKELRIEVPAQKVSEEYEAVLASFSQVARIPGFRAGRAPRDLVKRHYGKEIEKEVKDRLVPEGYHAAIDREKISPVAILDVRQETFAPGQPMVFSVVLDVPPEFSLPDYAGIPLEGRKVEVKDADVEEAIRGMLEQRARWNEVTGRPVQKGDLVQIDYEGVCEGQPLEQLAPKAAGLGKGKDFWVMADENAFLPAFGEGLLGTKPGDKKQILVDFPAAFVEPAVAGRKATYFVDVKAVREKQLPGIDGDLLKAAGVESEAQLKERVRDDLLKMGEGMEQRRQKNEIVKHLLEKTKLDVPESVVQQETRDIIYDIVREHSSRGASREQIAGQKDQIFEVASRNATEKVKIRYILHRIAEKEGVQALEDDVAQRVKDMAAQYGVPEAEFRAELERRNAMENLSEDIRVSKTLDLVLSRAKVKQT